MKSADIINSASDAVAISASSAADGFSAVDSSAINQVINLAVEARAPRLAANSVVGTVAGGASLAAHGEAVAHGNSPKVNIVSADRANAAAETVASRAGKPGSRVAADSAGAGIVFKMA